MTHRTHFFSVFFGVGIALVIGLGLGRVYMHAHQSEDIVVSSTNNLAHDVINVADKELADLEQELMDLHKFKQQAIDLEHELGVVKKYKDALGEKIKMLEQESEAYQVPSEALKFIKCVYNAAIKPYSYLIASTVGYVTGILFFLGTVDFLIYMLVGQNVSPYMIHWVLNIGKTWKMLNAVSLPVKTVESTADVVACVLNGAQNVNSTVLIDVQNVSKTWQFVRQYLFPIADYTALFLSKI